MPIKEPCNDLIMRHPFKRKGTSMRSLLCCAYQSNSQGPWFGKLCSYFFWSRKLNIFISWSRLKRLICYLMLFITIKEQKSFLDILYSLKKLSNPFSYMKLRFYLFFVFLNRISCLHWLSTDCCCSTHFSICTTLWSNPYDRLCWNLLSHGLSYGLFIIFEDCNE